MTTDLSPTERQAFVGFVHKIVDEVEAVFGPATIFEHGSCFTATTRRSACTDHAHVQIVPGDFQLSAILQSAVHYGSYASLLQDSRASAGYVMFKDPGGPLLAKADPGPSQFIRRIIASSLGEPDDWDYLVFPRWENVRATIDALASRATSGRSRTRT